jgi:hypothetical protein
MVPSSVLHTSSKKRTTTKIMNAKVAQILAPIPPQPILDFENLVKQVKNPRDKFLVAFIAAFVNEQSAQATINFLTSIPEPIDHNREMFGVKVKDVSGLTFDQAKAAYGLENFQVEEIRAYLGLQTTEKEN